MVCAGNHTRRFTRRWAVRITASFCCIQAPFRAGEKAGGLRESANSYRYWSPDAIVDQIGMWSSAMAYAISRSPMRCLS